MKILHITSTMHGGGIAAVICNLANEMVTYNDITVCTIFEPISTDIYYNRLSEKVKTVSCHKVKRGFSLKEIISIYKIIKEENYDIVHLHEDMYYYMFSIFMLWRKTKFVYTVHSHAKKGNARWDKRFLLIKKMIFKLGLVKAVTISEATQISFRDLYNCKSTLITNGIAKPILSDKDDSLLNNYKITKDSLVFFHAGRIDYPKNQLVLCKVFKRLIDEGHDVVLLMAGSSLYESLFKPLEPYLSKRINYLGERTDVVDLMSECDALCLPSIYEGMPIVIIEAFSVGCIPICSAVGGIVNMVKDGYNGFLSPTSNEDDYYECVKRFLTTSIGIKKTIKQHSKQSFSEYDIKTCSKKYYNLYQSIINSNIK